MSRTYIPAFTPPERPNNKANRELDALWAEARSAEAEGDYAAANAITAKALALAKRHGIDSRR